MRLLHESGTAQMWVQLQSYSRLLFILRLVGNEETTEYKLDEDKPIILALTNDLSIIFYIFLCLALGSLVVYVLELSYHKSNNTQSRVKIVYTRTRVAVVNKTKKLPTDREK